MENGRKLEVKVLGAANVDPSTLVPRLTEVSVLDSLADGSIVDVLAHEAGWGSTFESATTVSAGRLFPLWHCGQR